MTFNPQFSAVEYSGHMQFPRGVWLALTAVYAVSPVVSMPLSLLYSRNADHTLHEISPDRSEDEHFMDTVFEYTPGSGPVRKLRELMPTESTGDAANDELPLQTDSLGFSAISSASSNQLTYFGIPATVRLVGTSNVPSTSVSVDSTACPAVGMDPPPGSSALPVAMLVVMALNLLAICAFATFAFLERRRRRIPVESNYPDRDHKDTFITTHRLGSSLSCIKEDVYCRPQPARPLTPIGLSPSTPTFHNSPFSQTPYSRSLSPSAASVSASDISFHPLDAPKKKRSLSSLRGLCIGPNHKPSTGHLKSPLSP